MPTILWNNLRRDSERPLVDGAAVDFTAIVHQVDQVQKTTIGPHVWSHPAVIAEFVA